MHFKDQEIIKNIKTGQKYFKEINKLPEGKWIFRALRESEVEKIRDNEITIKSSFDEACDRAEISKKERWLYESWMLFEFKREAYNYLNNKPEPADFLEWLSIGRHYGMPSRLVDFTYSPYIVAYFALSVKGKKEKGYIIALNWEWMKDETEKNISGGWKNKLGTIKNKDASFHNPKLFQKVIKWKINYVAPVNPLKRNQRLAIQQGLFLCPVNIDESFDKNLVDTFQKANNVKKIFILSLSDEKRSETIRELQKMNISIATLYPDLIGWAESQRDLVHRKITDRRLIKELRVSMEKPYI